MSNYNSVKATINANIRANNNEEITGSVLNAVLNAMVTSLASGFIFKGMALAGTDPGTPDQNVFYVAKPGTYTYYGGVSVPDNNIGFIKYNGSWSVDTLPVGTQVFVADNLITNSATKALSARQGKIIGDALFGVDNDRSVTIQVAGNVPITGNTRYPTDVDIPAGHYNLSWSGGGILNDTNLYLLDGYGNSVSILNKYGTSVAAIQATSMASQSPYTIGGDVKQVKLYGGTPTATGGITFNFDNTDAATPGLQEQIGDITDLETDDKTDLVAAVNEVFRQLNSTQRVLPTMTATQIEQMEIASGFWWNGANASDEYFYVHFTGLKEGDLILLRNGDGMTCRCRFLQAYHGNSPVDAEGDNTSTLSIYRVPVGVDNAYLSYYNRAREANTYGYRISFTRRDGDEETPMSREKASASANETLQVVQPLVCKKNLAIDYYAKFSSFGSVRVGQGAGVPGGAYVIVNGTGVSFYIGESETPSASFNHGLTITDYLQVRIEVRTNYQARVILETLGGSYTSPYYTWSAAAGFIEARATMATTKAKVSYYCADWNKEFALVGDSYISYATDRYPYYLDNRYGCFDKMLACGMSGGEVGYTIPAVVLNFIQRPPRCLVWAMGMNDPDTESAVNRSWKYALDFIADLCEIYGTQLVLATIPNTPTMRNNFKNSIVKNSPYRYVDFALAVNAESVGASWYTGMLNQDNVHPTALGAEALAARFVQDFPDSL